MSSVKDITPEDAFKLIEENKENPNFIILDVRTDREYNEGYIDGCKLVDFQKPDFAQKVQALNPDQTYLIYCRSGMRSLNAAKMMINFGFTDVYNIVGGIMAWTSCNLPTK
jgi:rhodanese-related sulfurtransferase